MKIISCFTLWFMLGTLGCAHYSDVIPGKDGVHQITAAPTDDDDDPDEEELSRDALSQATDYCLELFQKKPQILSAKKSPIPDTERSIYQIIVRFKCR